MFLAGDIERQPITRAAADESRRHARDRPAAPMARRTLHGEIRLPRRASPERSAEVAGEGAPFRRGRGTPRSRCRRPPLRSASRSAVGPALAALERHPGRIEAPFAPRAARADPRELELEIGEAVFLVGARGAEADAEGEPQQRDVEAEKADDRPGPGEIERQAEQRAGDERRRDAPGAPPPA